MSPSEDAVFKSLQDLAGQVGALNGTLSTYMESRKQADAALDERLDKMVTATENVNEKAESAHRRLSRIKYTATGMAMAVGAFAKPGVEWVKAALHIANEAGK